MLGGSSILPSKGFSFTGTGVSVDEISKSLNNLGFNELKALDPTNMDLKGLGGMKEF